MTDIHYSASFRQQFLQQFEYWQRNIGAQAAQQLLADIIQRFELRVQQFPQGCPRCNDALQLGFDQYFEYVDSNAQVRIIYRASGTSDGLIGLLFLRTRQSLRDQLLELILMQP